MDGLRANCRTWIFDPARRGVFGDGKARLLRAVAEMGSLNAAAKTLGLSYRKAWEDLRKAESCTGLSLVARTRGGTAGGRTILTAEGERLLAAYERFQAAVRGDVDAAFEALRQEAGIL